MKENLKNMAFVFIIIFSISIIGWGCGKKAPPISPAENLIERELRNAPFCHPERKRRNL